MLRLSLSPFICYDTHVIGDILPPRRRDDTARKGKTDAEKVELEV